MRPLNLLIGPNGSGESNLVESLGLLRSAASKLAAPMRGPGGTGVKEWIWKGAKTGHARIEAIIANPSGPQPLRHKISFTETASSFDLVDEAIENRHPDQDALSRATRNCSNAYAKGKRSFEVLGQLDPAVLRQHLPAFARCERILLKKL